MILEERYYTQKVQFIQSILNLLHLNDWNNKLITKAEEECGFAKGYHYIIFPEGLREIIDFYEYWQDQLMLDHLTDVNTEIPTKIQAKIALALKIRIKNVLQLIHIKNYAYFIIPSNIMHATKIWWRTSDFIWNYAGDKSVDHNYYTKRSLLCFVYIASIMYYIQDKSQDHTDTDVFINESLSNIVNISFKFKKIFKLPELSSIPIIRLFS